MGGVFAELGTYLHNNIITIFGARHIYIHVNFISEDVVILPRCWIANETVKRISCVGDGYSMPNKFFVVSSAAQVQ